MSGWTAVVTIVGLMVVATIGFNASLWMRHKSVAAARGGWNDDDFRAALAGQGCSAEVIDAVRGELAPHYYADLAPRPEDDLAELLRIDVDELTEIVARLFDRLGVTPVEQEQIPPLATVADLADYIKRGRAHLTEA
ncbi:hypothetical protein M9980_02790 [Sphingomonas donggukensis]|uniref:Carrier domain-containing protein n=1 Tax=Sphingomonas donggukensis TaxID=2949093 RepID=A0ABY4TUU3_9SPHN|nr:hypothetical protein [Sphingomonas donggukensis]URW76175.1 hypothetical protein M9980_02790 [Sphingomonas donggukensis]